MEGDRETGRERREGEMVGERKRQKGIEREKGNEGKGDGEGENRERKKNRDRDR